MKTIYSIASVSFVIIFLSGCTKMLHDFEFEDKEPKIVIQAKFNPDTVIPVLVTRSLDMYDRREVKLLSEASVNLYSEDEILYTFKNDSVGWYSMDSGQVIPGENYRLEIEAEGYPKTSAEFYIPVLPEIDRVDTAVIKEREGYYSYWIETKGQCTIHFKDNPDTEDYYILSMKRKIQEINYNDLYEPTDTTYAYEYTDISSQSPYLDLVFTNHQEYRKIDGNESGSALKLIYSDKLFNGKDDVSIDILFDPGNSWESEDDENPEEFIKIIFTSVDRHFYQYASTKAEIYSTEGNPLAEPVTPYSNVMDGFGLVYGLSEENILVNVTGLFSED